MKKRFNKKKQRININIFKILTYVFLVSFVAYAVYFLVVFLGLRVLNPIKDSSYEHKILSQLNTDLEKTVYIFENERGGERRIADIYIFMHNKKKQNSFLIYIPGTLYFNGLEENFGSSISISSLRYAGEYLQEGRGIEYAIWQLSEIVGFKFNNYVWITVEANEKLNEIYGDVNEVKERYREGYLKESSDLGLSESFLKFHTLSSNFSSSKTFFKVSEVKDLDESIYSNLSFPMVLKRVGDFKNIVGSTETYSLDMSSSKYSLEEILGQGGQVRNINVSEFDKGLKVYLSKLMPRDLEKERVRVEVYNASGLSGKASLYARKFQNSGCDVVRYGTAPDVLEKTRVYISNKDDFGNSYAIVDEVLQGQYEVLEERPSFMTTGDVVIMLGTDIPLVEVF